jgi:hypothetical protein
VRHFKVADKPNLPKRDQTMVACTVCGNLVRAWRVETHPATPVCRVAVVAARMAARGWSRADNYGGRVKWLASAGILFERDLTGVVISQRNGPNVYSGYWAPGWAVWVLNQNVAPSLRRRMLAQMACWDEGVTRAWIEGTKHVLATAGESVRLLAGSRDHGYAARKALAEKLFRDALTGGPHA